MNSYFARKIGCLSNSFTCSSALFSTRKTSSIARHLDFPTRLPVLNAMVAQFKEIEDLPLSETAVIYVHHALRTSVDLLNALFSLGLSPENAFVLGKHYSENSTVAEEIKQRGVYYQSCSPQITLGTFDQSFISDVNSLWSEANARLSKNTNIKNVLILDHGGHATQLVPASIIENFKVVGLEKTTGGLITRSKHTIAPPFPLINMANCATKKILESPLIAEAIVDKLSRFIPISQQPTTCGVVGYGSIGKAVTNKLLSLGHKVIIYDSNPIKSTIPNSRENFVFTNDLISLTAFADLIFGCSGEDITKSTEAFRISSRDKKLISCSSEDREFLTLLQLIQEKNKQGTAVINVLNDVMYRSDLGGNITILHGGFPCNFDHSGESVPANDIQLTRALVLAGVFQAIDFFKNPSILSKKDIYALDAKWQRFIVQEWLKYQPKSRYEDNFLVNFNDLDWIQRNSSGISYEMTYNSEQDTVLKCA